MEKCEGSLGNRRSYRTPHWMEAEFGKSVPDLSRVKFDNITLILYRQIDVLNNPAQFLVYYLRLQDLSTQSLGHGGAMTRRRRATYAKAHSIAGQD